MSTESKNLYVGDNKLIAEIYDRITNDDAGEEVILLLLQSNAVGLLDKFKIVEFLARKNKQYYPLLLQLIANHIPLLESKDVFLTLRDFLSKQVYRASLISDEDILKNCQYIIYLISQGIADFYPFIRKIIEHHGEITSYSSMDLKILSHYSIVFDFDGYNGKAIEEVLKHNAMYSEQSFNCFRQLKCKQEKVYSQYAKAILYIMKKAFKGYKPDYDKFNDYLSEIPKKYRGELYIDSLMRNFERLYANLFKFYKTGCHKQTLI